MADRKKVLAELIENAVAWQPDVDPVGGQEQDRQPIVRILPNERITNDEAIAALARRPGVFQRGCILCRVVLDRIMGTHRIIPYVQASLSEALADAAQWIKSEDLSHPPIRNVAAILARGEWAGIPPLLAVAECPVMLRAGRVLSTPGYDTASGVLFAPARKVDFPEVPNRPTKQQVEAAIELLIEVVVDFPFATPAHRSAFFAAILTVLARPAIEGPTPLFAFDATAQGSGKTLLAQVLALIVCGTPIPVTPFPPNPDEMRKRLLAVAMAGDAIHLFDNVDRVIGDGALDGVLTSTLIEDRLLGRSENVKLPWRTVIVATGNNLEFGADTARRVLHVRLVPDTESPEERSGFRHPDLLQWIRIHHGQIVAAALTVLRAHAEAGFPAPDIRPWGSFEDWSRVVRGALIRAGLPDPCETRIELVATADRERGALTQFLAAFEEVAPPPIAMSSLQILEEANHNRRLAAAIQELVPSRSGTVTVRQLGARLGRFRGRILGGRALDFVLRQGDRYWRIVGGKVAQGGFAIGSEKDEAYREQNESRNNGSGNSSHPKPPSHPNDDAWIYDFEGDAEAEAIRAEAAGPEGEA